MIEARRPKRNFDKLKAVTIVCIFLASTLVLRLMYLQIAKSTYYSTLAAKEHSGLTELPARRGEIFIQDYHSKDNFKVATNTTLDTVYADPTLLKNPSLVADSLSDLLFNLADARKIESARIQEASLKLDPKLTQEDKNKILKPATDEELKKTFATELLNRISSKTRDVIIITSDLDNLVADAIRKMNIPGIEVHNSTLTAYPKQISDTDETAAVLAKQLNSSEEQLALILKGKNRYVILKKKITPEVSAKIKDLKKKDKDGNFKGIGLQPEYYRYYPEGTLGSNIIGFLDTAGLGEYGIEEKFDTLLKGAKGVFKTEKDSMGRQITVGESVIQPAVDGDNIFLTIDRSIQLEAERLVEKGVKDYNADGGEIIVMEPSTGKILAMAKYPHFDPNRYADVFKKDTVNLSTKEISRLVPMQNSKNSFWFYTDEEKGNRIEIFKEQTPDGTITYKKYANTVGPEAFKNKSVQESYEPGSVFKPVAMAAAVDDGDVTPNTTFFDSGPVKVDIYEIKNATNTYYGLINMTTVLEKSLNTGMAFVARKIGRTLFYNYIMKFGFAERTDIEFNNEDPGTVAHFAQWAESELITHAFGQGLTATPLQMISAYATLANKGIRMKPYVIDRIEKKNGQVVKTDPEPLNQVVSEKTAIQLTSMLTSAVENGVAKKGQVVGYYLAGKTGTAQTYFRGKPLSGTGTTMASMIGYGPSEKPKFVIMVKYDKPRSSEWADATSALTWKAMAEFLLNYFNVPKNKSK